MSQCENKSFKEISMDYLTYASELLEAKEIGSFEGWHKCANWILVYLQTENPEQSTFEGAPEDVIKTLDKFKDQYKIIEQLKAMDV